MATTLHGAIADWLGADATFASTFTGGLYFGGAPASDMAVYPYVMFHQVDSATQWLIGRSEYLETVRTLFVVQASDASSADSSSQSLLSILFDARGAGQSPTLSFNRGKVINRYGSVGSIELAGSLGLLGADVFPAVIDATFVVVRTPLS